MPKRRQLLALHRLQALEGMEVRQRRARVFGRASSLIVSSTFSTDQGPLKTLLGLGTRPGSCLRVAGHRCIQLAGCSLPAIEAGRLSGLSPFSTARAAIALSASWAENLVTRENRSRPEAM